MPTINPPLPNNPFANYIRQYCHQNELCLRQFAKRAGIPHSTLHELMKQNSDPKISYFIKLGQAMQVHPMVLLGLKWQHLHFQNRHLNSDRLGDVLDNAELEQGDLGGYYCQDKSAFITETVPDGTVVAVGATFTKTWVIQNAGVETWQDRQLICLDEPFKTLYPDNVDEHNFRLIPHQKTIAIATTHPQQTVTLSVDFTAPKVAGKYVSYWKMANAKGELCFPNSYGLSVCIIAQTFRMAY